MNRRAHAAVRLSAAAVAVVVALPAAIAIAQRADFGDARYRTGPEAA